MSGNLAGLKFDANKVDPNNKFEPLPAGDYMACIVASEMKQTKDGDGWFLELKLQILEGKYQNRTLFDRLNLVNKNETARQIAEGTLSAICRAVGVMSPTDSAELHNKALKISVKVKNDPQYGPGNEIKGYKSRHVGQQAPATPPATAAAPVPAQQLGPPLMTGPAAPRNPFAAS